jgi:hypothetical protein
MAPSSSNSHQPSGQAVAVGFGRGIVVGFVASMIGFLLMQKIINLHTHHVASSFDTGIHKQQGDMLEPTITLSDVSIT